MKRKEFLKISGIGLFGAPIITHSLSSCTTKNSENQRSQKSSIPIKLNPIDEYLEYDSLGLAQLIKNKEISSAELLDVIINRINKVNPDLNCIATKSYERAKELVNQINKNSMFAGVPILVKDMIDIDGIRRTDGSILQATNIPKKSVRYIEALENAGLNIVATTTTPEFANGLASKLYGYYRNPWNLNYGCMASSAGAAASVAAGIIPLVHGTDGGGSNRLPASACGLFGFKPSRGAMFSGETNGLHDTFKTNGPMSRTVRDAAALFAVGEDPNGVHSKIGFIKEPSNKRLKIAYARQGVKGMHLDKTIINVQDKTASLLKEMGHDVVEINHPLDGNEFYENFRFAFLPKYTPLLNMVKSISGKSPIESGLIEPWTASMIEISRNYTEKQIEKGTNYFNALSRLYQPVFSEFDIILSATIPKETPAFDFIKTTDTYEEKGSIFEHLLSLTAPINPLGDCAMNVPLFDSDKTKMPVGSMFHAKIGNDKLLFELAYELEMAQPWKDKWASNSLKYYN